MDTETATPLSSLCGELERGTFRELPAGGLASLQRAHDAELNFEQEEAQLWLARARAELGSEHARVCDLIDLRVAARGGAGAQLVETLACAEALLATELARPLRGRIELLRGALLSRLNRLDEAELALSEALDLIEAAPGSVSALDAFANVLAGQGAFEEARRLLRHVIAAKQALQDAQGVAASVGNLARLELRGGSPEQAHQLLLDTLQQYGRQLSPLTLLRLETAAVEVVLDAGNGELLTRAVAALQARLAALGDTHHNLIGFAEITLARAMPRPQAAAMLERAARSIALLEHVALLAFWREELLGNEADVDGWLPAYRELLSAAGPNTEAEVRGHLLVARRARLAGEAARAGEALEAATRCARAANNALWMSWVDDEAVRCDAPAASARVLLRFSGAAAERLNRTERVHASVLFADLVGFTSRSNELSPEEVMSTVRGLFEALTPVLARHLVRPLAYLGDGLLALADGAQHERRGVACAIELIARSERISRARLLAGEAHGLMLRAGIASGPVVLGPLGNQLKLDFTAIGMPVNLAARLQASADPGQVVVERSTAETAGVDCSLTEELALKGVAQKTEVVRLRVPKAH